MNKELTDLQDLKSAFVSHCKTLGCKDNYIKVCENKFNNIETALKEEYLLAEHYITYSKKQDEVLKIIKEKLTFNFNDETKSITITRNNGFMHITLFFDKQEEFDLLKELLL